MSRGLYLDMLAWGYHGSRHRPVTKRGANRRGARHTVCREDPRERNDRDDLRSMAGLLRRLLCAHGSSALPRAGLGADGRDGDIRWESGGGGR